MSKRNVVLSCLLTLAVELAAAGDIHLVFESSEGAFVIATPAAKTTLVVGAEDAEVVATAAEMLAGDIAAVTGQQPEVATAALSEVGQKAGGSEPIIAGTLGQSPLIDALAAAGKIDADAVRDRWEVYGLQMVEAPAEGVARALVVYGSTPRGTAYGLLELSRRMGVSPYIWWADVAPAKHEAVYAVGTKSISSEPSVRYRGIFINDEDWGLTPWAAKNLDKKYNNIGPGTYARVMELLLRLRANMLWPAMHSCSQAFWDNKDNLPVAKKYDIMLGSSHCEQMLRDNEWEWRRAPWNGTNEDWNYVTNTKKIQQYWEERTQESAGYDAMYTLGMRGVHDWGISGYPTTEDKVRGLTDIIAFQRSLIQKHIGDPTQVPQLFIPYKEVLDAYNAGLQVPEDVTLCWVDDNHGYIRQLPVAKEQARSGGNGVYYHVSYWGTPHDYLWLCSHSPSLISYELSRAYAQGVRTLWVINVGDIKPAEKEISFVMDLAWDINRWPPQQAARYTVHWAGQTFGPAVAADIGRLQARYYQLQAAGKDAHVYFVSYSEEQIARRLDAYSQLAAEAEALSRQLPPRLRDAYFELVLYPIRGASLINHYQLLARRSMARAADGRYQEALADADSVRRALDQLNQLTRRYNEDICHGKWRHFFSWQPYHWFRSKQIDPPICTPELVRQAANLPAARMLSTDECLSPQGTIIQSEVQAEVPLWIEALTPIRNFSKEAADNVFCHVATDSDSFAASATPINNVWHATHIGPMWSRVGTIHLHQGQNHLRIDSLKPAITTSSSHVYSLDGRLVGTNLRNLPKGVYIVNNKKVVKQ